MKLLLPFALVVTASWARGGDLDLGTNPHDLVVYRPKMPYWPFDRCDRGMTGDRYNDHFQVIYDVRRRTYFAFWTQASVESSSDQHIAFSKSTDGGGSWSSVRILAGSENRRNPRLVASWQQPMLTKSGRLYLLWNQQTSSLPAHWGEMFGIFSDDAGENWSAPQSVPWPSNALKPRNPGEPHNWCIWQRPLRLGPGGAFYAGVSHYGQVVDFISYGNMDEDPAVKDIRVAFHQTGDAILQASPDSPKRWVEEASIVKLPDGRLFAILRSWTGSPLWTQSRDEGRTWAPLRKLVDANGRPYRHCCSPCPMYDWKGCEAASGTYFAFIHNTFDENDRKNGAWQKRGPLYLIAGTFDPTGEQPVRFGTPKLFAPRKDRNSFYTSYTVDEQGRGILWFPDMKYWLLGRRIGREWFE